MAVAIDRAVDVGLAQEQRRQPGGQTAEGERLLLLLMPPQPGAELGQEAQADLRIPPNQRL